MRNIIKNKGLVIKVQDYLENAVLATVLTSNGKETLIIRGAKKINRSTNKLASILTLIEYNHTETKGLSTLTEGIIIDNYTSIKDDIVKYNYIMTIFEKISFFSEQITDYDIVFNFIIEILEKAKSSFYINALSLIFEIKFLYLLGVSPLMNRCPLCGNIVQNGALDIKNGGFLCEKCYYLNEVNLSVSDSMLFKKIYTTKLKNVSDEFLKEINNHININKCINKYYEWHLDFKSKVKEILEKIG